MWTFRRWSYGNDGCIFDLNGACKEKIRIELCLYEPQYEESESERIRSPNWNLEDRSWIGQGGSSSEGKKVFDQLTFSEVVKTTFLEVRGYRVFTARKIPNKAREIMFGEAENVQQSTTVHDLMYLFNNEKLFMILPWVSSILGIIYWWQLFLNILN